MKVKSTLLLHSVYRSVHRVVSVLLRTAKTRLSFLVHGCTRSIMLFSQGSLEKEFVVLGLDIC